MKSIKVSAPNRGTPISVAQRDDGGLLVRQGAGLVRVAPDEIDGLIEALTQLKPPLSPSGHRGLTEIERRG